MIKSLANTLGYFRFFYSYLRYRVLLSILLNGLVGLFDGFGLAMFLPLLNIAAKGSGEGSDLGIGVLEFIPDAIESMGLELSLPVVLGIMCIFFALKGLARQASESYRVVLIEYFTRTVRLELIDDLRSLRFKSFVQADVGRIQNTLVGEVGAVVNAATAFFQVLQQLVLVCVYVFFAVALNAQFAALVVIGALSTNILYRQVYKRTRGASYKVTDLLNRLQGLLIQFTGNYKYLKATGSLQAYDHRLKDVAVNVERENRKIGMLNAILLSVKEPILVAVVSLVIYLQNGVLGQPLEPILTSLLYFYRSLTALIIIQNHWNKFVARTGSMDNMIDFSQYLKANRETTGQKTITSFRGNLTVRDLNFGYQGKMVLEKINLEIQGNEVVAFVGESGSGKTTLINILAGLMPPDQGFYEIDGQNSQELDIATFQSRIGYITQEPVIFNDTLFNNVTFWAERNEANMAKFNEALEKAAIKDFVDELPAKDEALLGNNGINLSGGQKQRISIARELYKDIDILIMDEATSALDSETERSIQDNLEALRGSYTMLVVAHRLSTVRNADRIVLMDRGRIVEIGNFAELRKKSDKFRVMVEHQEF